MSVPPPLEALWEKFCASDFALRAFGDWMAHHADLAIGVQALARPRRPDRPSKETPSAKPPEPQEPGPLRYQVGEFTCPAHGKFRCSDLAGTLPENYLCPVCSHLYSVRIVGRSIAPQTWTALDQDAGAAAGRKNSFNTGRSPKTCSVPGCGKNHLAKGLCAAHYRARGTPKKEEE